MILFKVCFSVDQSSDKYSKYKEFVSREVDSPVGEHFGEVCNLLSCCIQRGWERILFTDDFDWISSTSSEWPSRSIRLAGIDESQYQVKINRMQNLRMILHWLLCGQENDEDGGDCFRAILHDLSVRNPGVTDKPITQLAVAIEENLLSRIVDITDQLRQNYQTCLKPERMSTSNTLQWIVCRLPSLSIGDAATTMLTLNHKRGHFHTIWQDDDVLVDKMSDDTYASTLLELETRIDETRLVWESERELVPDLLFLTLQQFTIHELTEADGVRLGEGVRLGGRGMACRHCSVGLACNATWRLLPNRQKTILHQDTLWRTMISHIVGCDWCPSVIKCEIKQFLDECLDSNGNFLVRGMLERAADFLHNLQCRVDDSSAGLTSGAKEAISYTNSLPCRDLGIDVCPLKLKKSKRKVLHKSHIVSASDAMSTREVASIIQSLVLQEVTLRMEEQQNTTKRPVEECVLLPKECPDLEAMVPAESPPEETTRPDATNQRNSGVPICKRLQMDSLSRISLGASTPDDKLVRKRHEPRVRRNLRSTVSPPSVLEGVSKSSLESGNGINPSHVGRTDRKRRSVLSAVASDCDAYRILEVRKKAKKDESPVLGSAMNVKRASPATETSVTESNTNDRTVDVHGEPQAECSRLQTPCQLSCPNPSQGSQDIEITHICGEPRRKSPENVRDPSELPHLAAHCARTPSTKNDNSRPASTNSESPRKVRKTVSRLPVGSPRTHGAHVAYDSLAHMAPAASFGCLHIQFPYPFALSRKDPDDQALKTFLGMTNFSLQDYVDWIFKLSEFDDVAVLHRICLWRGSNGRIFESMEESSIFESICSDLPSPADDSQSVLCHIHSIKTMFVIRNSQGSTRKGTSDPLSRQLDMALDRRVDDTTSNLKGKVAAVSTAAQGFRPASPRVPFPPSAAWQCRGSHTNLSLLTNEEVIEASGGTTIPVSHQHLA